ncbi:MAG: hypothetical protein ACYCQK_01825 [Acidiferrobacteraceae bacterium]
MSVSERVKIELREVRQLLEAAEHIADGLVAVCEHAYQHDHAASDALAAATRAAGAIADAREKAEDREDAARERSAG